MAIESISEELVPGDKRMTFLPRFFGRRFLRGEALLYAWLTELSSDYKGGFWNMYTLSNGGHYLAPNLPIGVIRLVHWGNYYEGYMSPGAAGIVACFFSLGQLMGEATGDERQLLVHQHYLLRDYVEVHPERDEILKAID